MEPITHFLTGACISRAVGLNRKTLYATTTLVLAAEAPDLDVLAYFRDPISGFAHHRGITHTFIAAPAMAAVVIGFMYMWSRVRRRPETAGTAESDPRRVKAGSSLPPEPRWGLLYAWACVSALSHILLDFTNNYGVRPFDPFSYKWYSWDIVFIFEPLLWLFLIGGLLLPALFGLINEEIGEHRRGPRGRVGAVVALALMVALWGLRDYEHRRALAILDARLYHGAEPLRISAYPYYVNPFKWYGVVETENFFERTIVNSLQPDASPDISLVRYKPEETPVSLAAKRSYLGRVYLDWAQWPAVEVEALEPPSSGYLVRFYDLRFQYPDRQLRGATLGARVLLNSNMQVIAEAFGARTQRPDLLPPPSESGKSR